MCRANRQKIDKGIHVLNNTITQPNASDIYTLNSTAEDWIFLSNPQETFTKIGYILYLETQLDKIKRLKITPTIFSDQNGIKLEVNNESESEVVQLCPTLCNPMDCGLQGSSIHGIFQAGNE